jgi:hypothetical protein
MFLNFKLPRRRLLNDNTSGILMHLVFPSMLEFTEASDLNILVKLLKSLG